MRIKLYAVYAAQTSSDNCFFYDAISGGHLREIFMYLEVVTILHSVYRWWYECVKVYTLEHNRLDKTNVCRKHLILIALFQGSTHQQDNTINHDTTG